MGSAASQPVPTSEKCYATAAPARRPERSAADLLASLSLRDGKAAPSAVVTLNTVAAWEEAFESKEKNRVAQTFLHKADFTQALVSRQAVVNDLQSESSLPPARGRRLG